MVSSSAMAIWTPWRAALALVALLTAVRLTALFATPLQLYPDEAQYWLWSRTLDWGYYSKPPMVAWLIAFTTSLGGDAEPWVRISALWLHAGAALALFAAARRLYDDWTGFWAAALYSLMPGVQLSSGVIATDAPLLFFLSLALWAYVALVQGRTNLAALALGAALGGAALSKYAALYFLAGLIAHAVWSRAGRSAWSRGRLALAALALAVVLGPNLLWNASHGFATVAHTAENADWDAAQRFQVTEAADFLGAQFGVFGPIPFAVLLAGSVALALRRRLERADLLLLGFILPALLIVTVQAFITRANANWAAAAYAPAAVLVAAWLVRWRARRLQGATVALQGAAALAFYVLAAAPALADQLGLENSFKRARGWRETAEVVLDRVRREPGLTAVAVDDRFYFNALAYYGRSVWTAAPVSPAPSLGSAPPSPPPLLIWVRERAAQNQAETTHPLTPARGARVLAVSGVPDYRAEMKADFARTSRAQDASVALGPRRTRDFQLFVGEGFRPRSRDSLSGRPTTP